jgi:NAD(P)-dependent dehydrogenase (short-subunit alcohol dehydrogenase family)
MKDKICIVTGASSGLGKATAELLAGLGANVIMTSRLNKRGELAYNQINNIAAGKVSWVPADLSSLKSVRALFEAINKKYEKVNFLFNCAGVILIKRNVTTDGYESMFVINYLSNFLLTNLLYKKLLAGSPSKVITVSGRGHKPSLTEGINKGTIDFNDLQGAKHFSFPKAAKQAVLAKIMFTYELARKWQSAEIEACTVCPGLVKTNIVSHLPWYVKAYMAVRFIIQNAQSPHEGASHLITLATTKENVNGKYFEGSRNKLKEAKSLDESYDRNSREKLWKVSELLVGQKFEYK